mgnify:CR=1 FL=1
MNSSTDNTSLSPFLQNSVQPAKAYIADLLKDRDNLDKAENSTKDVLYGVLGKCLQLRPSMQGGSDG